MPFEKLFVNSCSGPGYRMGKSSANPSYRRGRVLHISSNVRCKLPPYGNNPGKSEFNTLLMKTMKTKYLFQIIILLISLACTKENKVDPDSIDQITNSPPGPFTISITNVSHNSAEIKWGPSIDPDNDTLFYTVYLNDSILMENLNVNSAIKIVDLKQETEYFGKIEVTDKKSEKVVVPYSFTTKKYFLVFNKTIPIKLFTIVGQYIEKTSDQGYIATSNIRVNPNVGTYVLKMDSLGNELWNSTIIGPLGSDINQIKQTSDNGYILNNRESIIRLDPKGNEIWRYPKAIEYNNFASIVVADNNKFIVVKTTLDSLTTELKLEVFKLDENGGIVWKKYYGDLPFIYVSYIEKTIDGNYIILGNEGPDFASRDFDLFILKIDGEGNVLWKKTLENPLYDHGQKIKQTRDNGFIILSWHSDNREVTTIRLVKVDETGNLVWSKSFSWDIDKTLAYGIEQTEDGGYIFCGTNGYSPNEAILVRLDGSGEILWKNIYKPDFIDYSWIGSDVKQTSDGGFIMVGTKSYTWSNETQIEYGLWILKTDDKGKLNNK